MFYDTHRDLEMRLSGTIIQYEGRAVEVVRANENLTVDLVRLIDGFKFEEIRQDDPFLKMVAPTLGYLNLEDGSLYAVRKPARMWKQGLSKRHLFFPDAIRVPGALINSQVLGSCLDNIYPTLEQALAKFEGTNPFKHGLVKSVAFAKHWAVTNDNGLLYKTKVVGNLEDKPTLHEKYAWLAETLEEVVDAKG